MKKKLIFIVAVFFVLAVIMVACAPKTPRQAEGNKSESSEEQKTAISVEWSPDSECAVCHTDQQASYDASACLSSQAEGNCFVCHTDTDTLATVHVGKTADSKMAQVLRKTVIPEEICLSCHYETKEALLTATPDLAVTDSNKTAKNPHDLPAHSDHEEITCSSCHSMHDETPVQEQAKATCVGCHHKDVFECHTCH